MKNLYRNEDGTIAMLFGITIFVLFGVLALSLGSTKVQSGYEKNYNSTDATALGVAEWVMRGKIEKIGDPEYSEGRWANWEPSAADLNEYAENFFASNMDIDGGVTEDGARDDFSATYDSETEEVTVQACSMVSKNLIGSPVSKGEAQRVCSESRASFNVSKTIQDAEIALSVDASTSMASAESESPRNARLVSLKGALNFLFDEYVTDENRDSLLFSIVPFASNIYFKNYETTLMEGGNAETYNIVPVFNAENLRYNSPGVDWIGGNSFVKLSKANVPTRQIVADNLAAALGAPEEPVAPTPPWISDRQTYEDVVAYNDPRVLEEDLREIFEQYNDEYEEQLEQFNEWMEEYEAAFERYEDNYADYEERLEAFNSGTSQEHNWIRFFTMDGKNLDDIYVQPLTGDIDLLKEKVDSMKGIHGGTHGVTGILGAFLTLHDGWSGKWNDDSVNEEVAGAGYDRSSLPSERIDRKFIIHLTDGEDNDGNGLNGFTTTIEDFPKYGSDVYKPVCYAVNNRGIEMYMILLGTNRQGYHNACYREIGLDPDEYIFDNIQPDELQATYETIFDIIATKTSSVRLTK